LSGKKPITMNVEKAVESLPLKRGELVWKLYEQLKCSIEPINQQYKDLTLEKYDLYLFDGGNKTKNFILIDFNIRKECTIFQKGMISLHLDANLLLSEGFVNRTLYNIVEYEMFTSVSEYNTFCTTSTNLETRKSVGSFNHFIESEIRQIINKVV